MHGLDSDAHMPQHIGHDRSSRQTITTQTHHRPLHAYKSPHCMATAAPFVTIAILPAPRPFSGLPRLGRPGADRPALPQQPASAWQSGGGTPFRRRPPKRHRRHYRIAFQNASCSAAPFTLYRARPDVGRMPPPRAVAARIAPPGKRCPRAPLAAGSRQRRAHGQQSTKTAVAAHCLPRRFSPHASAPPTAVAQQIRQTTRQGASAHVSRERHADPLGSWPPHGGPGQRGCYKLMPMVCTFMTSLPSAFLKFAFRAARYCRASSLNPLGPFSRPTRS